MCDRYTTAKQVQGPESNRLPIDYQVTSFVGPLRSGHGLSDIVCSIALPLSYPRHIDSDGQEKEPSILSPEDNAGQFGPSESSPAESNGVCTTGLRITSPVRRAWLRGHETLHGVDALASYLACSLSTGRYPSTSCEVRHQARNRCIHTNKIDHSGVGRVSYGEAGRRHSDNGHFRLNARILAVMQ
jgi:hypothetical protein